MIERYGDTFRFIYSDGTPVDDISQISAEEVAELLASYRGLVRGLEHSLDEARKSRAARVTPSGTVKIRIGTARRRATPKAAKPNLAKLADLLLSGDRGTLTALINKLTPVATPPQKVEVSTNGNDDVPF